MEIVIATTHPKFLMGNSLSGDDDRRPPRIIEWGNNPRRVLRHPRCSQTRPTKHNPYEGLGMLEAHKGPMHIHI
jgi:hypothetical protein